MKKVFLIQMFMLVLSFCTIKAQNNYTVPPYFFHFDTMIDAKQTLFNSWKFHANATCFMIPENTSTTITTSLGNKLPFYHGDEKSIFYFEDTVIDDKYFLYLKFITTEVGRERSTNNGKYHRLRILNDKEIALSNGHLFVEYWVNYNKGEHIWEQIMEITAPKPIYKFGDLIFTDSLYGRIITQVEDSAFMNDSVAIKVDSIITGYTTELDSLTGVFLPNTVKTIGKHAFAYCKNITRISLGEQLQSIGDSAFAGLTHLDTVFVKSYYAPTIKENTFVGVSKGCVIVVPSGRKAHYQGSQYWSEFFNIIEAESTVSLTEVSGNPFSVYPNPAKDKITIETDGDISIFNNKGQLVKIIKDIRGVANINIDDLESGVYYVKTINETKKLIIK